MADVERQAEQMPWGHCGRGTERIIEAVDTVGADNVQISLNRVAFLLRRGAITRSGRRVRCQAALETARPISVPRYRD
jgi:hypothetical protein